MIIIVVNVKPRSKQNSLKETAPGYYEARLTAAPFEGKANDSLIALLSKHFKVAKSLITVASGGSSRRKVVEICNN